MYCVLWTSVYRRYNNDHYNWGYNWRAGASQPSRTAGSDFSILGECMALLASGSDPTASGHEMYIAINTS